MRFPLLALLANGPAHGYELKQAMEQRFGSVLPPLNAGQIYTTLSRLERDGLVDDDAVAQNGRPNKRVYRLTEAGPDRAERVGRGLDAADAPQGRLLHQAGARPGRGDRGPARADRPPARRLPAGAARAGRRRGQATTTTAALLVEGAALHLEADLKWLDLCEQRMTNGS